MKNIVYQSPSFSDAQGWANKRCKNDFVIDSHVSSSRVDANGVLCEQHTYHVIEIINFDDQQGE